MSYAYTSGIFDLFHAGHMESINKILDIVKGKNLDGLIIGVCTDSYASSYKRVPLWDLSRRLNTIQKLYPNTKVIIDPLVDYKSCYTPDFYDAYNISLHIQGGEFEENSSVYDYMINKNAIEFIGRSTLCSTTELIDSIRKSEVKDVGGHSNDNFYTNNTIVKIIKSSNLKEMDSIYNQLKEIGYISDYRREGNVVFLPFIEGEVTPQSLDKVLALTEVIHSLDLKVNRTIMDLFKNYEFIPDSKYDALLGQRYICHGDLVYTNVINNNGDLIAIDWEYLLLGPRYWDLACYILSSWIYNGIQIIERDPEIRLTIELVRDYWLAWSDATRIDYHTEQLKSLELS